MASSNSWHSKLSHVYHNNDHCEVGHRILNVNARRGTGGKELCGMCADLAGRGVARIMKDWDKTPDGRIHSIIIPHGATWPLSQYLR